MNIAPKRVKEIFLVAAELPDQTAQIAYLEHVCGEDSGLRERVEVLLRSHDPASSFLGTPAVELAAPEVAVQQTIDSVRPGYTPRPGHEEEEEALGFLAPATRPDSLGRIGHYEVLQVLGKGGFGIVLRAFDDILQRVVAIKIMAPQLAATSPARRRFLREKASATLSAYWSSTLTASEPSSSSFRPVSPDWGARTGEPGLGSPDWGVRAGEFGLSSQEIAESKSAAGGDDQREYSLESPRVYLANAHPSSGCVAGILFPGSSSAHRS